MQHDDKQAQRRQREQQKWAQTDQRDLDDFVRAMFEHRSGRRYALWLMSIANGMGTDEIFTTNALMTAFNTGTHNVGKQIWAHMLDVAPDAFFKALKEQADERTARGHSLDGSGEDNQSSGDQAG